MHRAGWREISHLQCFDFRGPANHQDSVIQSPSHWLGDHSAKSPGKGVAKEYCAVGFKEVLSGIKSCDIMG